jgi:hypothetical protein
MAARRISMRVKCALDDRLAMIELKSCNKEGGVENVRAIVA